MIEFFIFVLLEHNAITLFGTVARRGWKRRGPIKVILQVGCSRKIWDSDLFLDTKHVGTSTSQKKKKKIRATRFVFVSVENFLFNGDREADID